jgi:hypothetical protein
VRDVIKQFESFGMSTGFIERGTSKKRKKMQYPAKVTQYLKWLSDRDIPFIRIEGTQSFLILLSKGEYHYLSIEFRYMTDAYFKTNMKHFKVKRYKCESSAQAVVKTNRYLRLENVN